MSLHSFCPFSVPLSRCGDCHRKTFVPQKLLFHHTTLCVVPGICCCVSLVCLYVCFFKLVLLSLLSLRTPVLFLSMSVCLCPICSPPSIVLCVARFSVFVFLGILFFVLPISSMRIFLELRPFRMCAFAVHVSTIVGLLF